MVIDRAQRFCGSVPWIHIFEVDDGVSWIVWLCRVGKKVVEVPRAHRQDQLVGSELLAGAATEGDVSKGIGLEIREREELRF